MSTVTITNYRPFERGLLKAFFTVELPSGLIVHGVKLFEENGNRWIGMPSEKFTDRTGATSFKLILEFRDRDVCDALRDQILAALDAQHLPTRPTPAKQSEPPRAAIPDDQIPF